MATRPCLHPDGRFQVKGRRRLVWWMLVVFGIALGLLAEFVMIQADFDENHWLDLAVGWAFMAAGLATIARRPSKMGALLTATGFAWFVGNFVVLDIEFFKRLGALESISIPMMLHVVFAYPKGRIKRNWERILVAVAYASVAMMGVIAFLFAPANFCEVCPKEPAPFANQAVTQGAILLIRPAQLIISLGTIALLVRRFAKATHFQRRNLREFWIAGAAMALILPGLGFAELWAKDWFDEIFAILNVTRIIIPVSLFFGLVRLQLARAAVGGLVADIGSHRDEKDLRDALARALDDPGLEVHYHPDGATPPLTEDDDQVSTVIERDGTPILTLVHDAALRDRPELAEAAAGAALLALENARLAAEVQSQLEEVRASRARIVEAADAERVRIERNLHDGAQQRLLSLSFALRDARRTLEGKSKEEAAAKLESAIEELKEALAELRELARGIHPTILDEAGLGPALQSIAERSAVPTEVDLQLDGRLPGSVEATAYFVVAESIANATRHSGATQALVRARVENGALSLEVVDDGEGGADPSAGSGLRGLADRVAAVGGHLEVRSLKGEGTQILAEIPCE